MEPAHAQTQGRSNRAAPLELWAVDPTRFGFGKIHIISPKGNGKTVCGTHLGKLPGKRLTRGEATCINCVSRLANQEERKARDAEWWAKYDAYLETPEWLALRDLVLDRSDGVCEGCGLQRAVQVHHVTYEHVFHEFLWELRAVCLDCHKRIHDEEES